MVRLNRKSLWRIDQGLIRVCSLFYLAYPLKNKPCLKEKSFPPLPPKKVSKKLVKHKSVGITWIIFTIINTLVFDFVVNIFLTSCFSCISEFEFCPFKCSLGYPVFDTKKPNMKLQTQHPGNSGICKLLTIFKAVYWLFHFFHFIM